MEETPKFNRRCSMVVIGLILLILGLVFAVHSLFVLGLVLLLVGLVFNFIPMGGSRRRYW